MIEIHIKRLIRGKTCFLYLKRKEGVVIYYPYALTFDEQTRQILLHVLYQGHDKELLPEDKSFSKLHVREGRSALTV